MYKLRVKIGQTRFIKTFNSFDSARDYMKHIQNKFVSAEFKRLNF